MTISVCPLHPLFGAVIAGDAQDGAAVSAIEDAMGRFGLLLFRGLELDDRGLERFAARFGPLQNMSGSPGVERHVIRVSNLAEDGTIKPANEVSRIQHEANLLWHADSSFMVPGAAYSFLYANIVPRAGGRTEFCDMRAAWDALPAARKDRLGSLRADHSMMHSWRLSGVDLAAVAAFATPTVRRQLVPIHRPSGRRALMIPSHVAHLEGMDDAESRALLDDLTAFATADGRTYAHDWQPGDLLIWDNRCMLHRVTGYRDFEEPRDLRSCRVIDRDDQGVVVAEPA